MLTSSRTVMRMSSPLKVTSPRMEQDVFYFTPSGRPDRPDARRMDQQTSSSRASYEPEQTDETTEQSKLGVATDGGAGTAPASDGDVDE